MDSAYGVCGESGLMTHNSRDGSGAWGARAGSVESVGATHNSMGCSGFRVGWGGVGGKRPEL
eukprot:352362-Chlamydomonas_euryale.AAC.5